MKSINKKQEDSEKTQVNKAHYEVSYDGLDRFISYYHQIDLIRKIRPKKILEIGVGNKTLSDYLKRHGYNITTCDFATDLKPDYVADVRNLPFKDNEFDLIVIFEVLEHIPYDDFEKALRELRRVSSRNTIISVPYSQIYICISVIFPFIKKILGMSFINLFLGFRSFLRIKFKGEHYWEIGRWNYPLKRIRKDINKYFKIIKEKRALPHPVHYFFVLEKR